MLLKFTKYQGLGNDFIVVDSTAGVDVDGMLAARLCDRRRGVGADGVLVVGPAERDTVASMTVLNADGSRPEMCGNGLRCVALHLASGGKREFSVRTDAGPRRCSVGSGVDEAEVTIETGPATLGAPLQLINPDSAGAALEFSRVSVGNPHAVVFDLTVDEAMVDRLGPWVSAQIAGGANVEFAASTPSGLDVIVWERGVGRTEACGTGAVATAAAAAVQGRVRHGQPVEVRLPGGSLWVTVAADSLETTLRGPARRVFDGTFRC